MSNQKASSLTSSNFWNNAASVAVGILLAFFTPDLALSETISGEVSGLVAAVKAANWGGVALIVFNLGNILYHLFRK